MTVTEEKKLLRQKMHALSAALPSESAALADAGVIRNVLASAVYRRAERIFAYFGTGDEIDTRPLLSRILADGKRLYLPRVGSGRQMDAAEVRSLFELRPDRYGIPSPLPSASAADAGTLSLVLVPCLAATEDAFRLGHGGGYYDAFLAAYGGVSFLLARECSVLPHIPLQPHDLPCTALITERRPCPSYLR